MNNKYLHHKKFTDLDTGEKIDLLTDGYSVPGGLSKKAAFDKIQEKIENSRNKKNNKIQYRTIALLSMAASVLLIVGWFFLFNNSKMLTITAETGQQVEQQLPDGSIVTLNAGSELKYNKNNFDTHRELELSGEAFFEVKKGDEFIVRTPNGDVEVLGTSFNVFARTNKFVVSCKTGKVKVISGNVNQIIKNGEIVKKYGNKLLKSELKNINQTGEWRHGIFHFENTSLISIFGEIERQFGVTVRSNNTEGMKFTGSFSNQNLTQALDIICIPMGLNYEIKNNNTVLIRAAE